MAGGPPGSLHCRGHRAGAEHIRAEIGTMIDAREHQVGRSLHQLEQRQLHAIGWRATAGPCRHALAKQLIRPFGPNRLLQGEAMTGGRAFLIRTDNGHMVAPGSRCQGQSFDAIGKHAVVITDQDPQRGHGMPEGLEGT